MAATDVLVFLKGIKSEKSELASMERYSEELRRSLLPATAGYNADDEQTKEIMALISQLSQQEEAHKLRLAGDINTAVSLIDRMQTPQYRELLRLRYIYCVPWEQIAVCMGYTNKHVMGYLHGRAVAEARAIWVDKVGI